MAKSLRSKVKQAAGRKRRSDSHYAVAESARIQRLSDKLLEKSRQDKVKEEAASEAGAEVEGDDTKMEGDAEETKVSTSGPRKSRREEWRRSKGMPVKRERNKAKSTTKSGGSKSFKPKRRR